MNDAVKGRRVKRSVEPEGISEIKAPDASFRADKCKDGNGIEVRLMGVPKAAVQELAPNTRAILEVTRSETSSAEILDLGRVAAFTGEGSGKLRSFPSATGIRARLLFADAETSKIVRYLDGLRIAGPNDNDSGEGDSGAEFPLEFVRSTLEGEPWALVWTSQKAQILVDSRFDKNAYNKDPYVQGALFNGAIPEVLRQLVLMDLDDEARENWWRVIKDVTTDTREAVNEYKDSGDIFEFERWARETAKALVRKMDLANWMTRMKNSQQAEKAEIETDA